MHPPIDALKALRAGGQSAQLVVAHYAPRLLRFFSHLGEENSNCEDLTQEVFLNLVRKKARYEERGRFAAYIFQVAYCVWVDKRRKRQTATMPNEELKSIERPQDCATLPIQQIIREEDAARLRAVLRKLPEDQRVICELGLLEEMPYRDIAKVLGIPEGTVKSRMFAAVRKLKDLLETKVFKAAL